VLRKTAAGTTSRSSGGRAAELIERMRPTLQQWEDLCDELGEQPGDVALAWLLHQPAVTGPIIGPRTPEQLAGALRALEIELDEKVLARIDELFPGPGGTAPEAYAW
jgi:aryl-alcohol dehydrogenase-like predicted oxidoreductase